MFWIKDFYSTSIGKKIVVALTGIILFGFVFLHMLGNLKIFLGFAPNGMNHLDIYAHFLRTMGEDLFGYGTILWITRGVLLVALTLHVFTVFKLRAINLNARSVNYKILATNSSTIASKTMKISGLILLAFIIFHILHFTQKFLFCLGSKLII